MRPDQVEFLAGLRAAFAAGHRVVVGQAPTGFGKTTVAVEILKGAVAKGPALFLAHLDALIVDTARRAAAAGLRAGVIQADEPADPAAPLQVASLQTLHRRGSRPPARFVVQDEGHRVMGRTVRELLADYPDARVLLLTATPQRGDGQPLGDVATALVAGPAPRWLMDRGLLVPAEVIAPPDVEERGLTTTPLRAYQRWTPGARAIVFCGSVEHAQEVAGEFVAAGIAAEALVGETTRSERRAIRARLEAGATRVLVGVTVFLEGFDWPGCEAVVLARAFSVTGSFLQAIGRGLRPAAGKTKCTVVDLRGSVHLHGLPDEARAWSLTGEAVRSLEAATPLRRCAECLAIFRPAPACPRCGAAARSAPKLPRVLNRAERLARLEELPPAERDRRYLQKLEQLALTRMRMPEWRAKSWAARQFEKTRGRKPEVAA